MLDRVDARTSTARPQFALIAAKEAWAHAGAPAVDPERLAVVIASGIGGVITLLDAYDVLKEKGFRRVSPHTVPMLMPNSPASTVGLEVGARAGVHTPVSACASGAEAIAVGLEMIRKGTADVVVCGGTEAAIHVLPLAGFAAMRALSLRNDEPERASRPYDKGRDGFVLGEGAGVLVLESAAHAAARGAKVLARSPAPASPTTPTTSPRPTPTGSGATRAMRMALEDAQMDPSEIVHINAHATSTPAGRRRRSRSDPASVSAA